MEEVRPQLYAGLREQFDACRALYAFATDHRPGEAPSGDLAGQIILWTYARATKTFRASYRLAAEGYGQQALMLNRSLFEDNLISHWVARNSDAAPARFERHERYAAWQEGAARKRNKLAEPDVVYPTLTEGERKRLRREFSGKTWTGLTLAGLLASVRDEWHADVDRLLLHQMVEVLNTLNNTLLHHGSGGLQSFARYDELREAVSFEVGPSPTYVRSALAGAFWNYSHVSSLVLRDEAEAALGDLYRRHIVAFVTERPAS